MDEEKEVLEQPAEEVNLHEQYKNKSAEMKEKYHDVIVEIANKRGVDMGVAFDMLKAICRGGDYGQGIEINLEELQTDYDALCEISDKIANSL